MCFRSYYGLINIKTGPFFWNFKKTRLKFSWIHLLEDGSSVQKCIFFNIHLLITFFQRARFTKLPIINRPVKPFGFT